MEYNEVYIIEREMLACTSDRMAFSDEMRLQTSRVHCKLSESGRIAKTSRMEVFAITRNSTSSSSSSLHFME